ncbi:phage protein [Yersinia phage phiR1-RT]|uniref:Phage protein n=1 Tax=Yersinia phage phiR1-RT TaxID=1206558 RepID=I7LEP1_BPPR1|nr:hypothetical protein BN80_207 [Yersinia phage phiR1-RT]CCI88777.1 phage protein [Yersinia phage phiR1-RT]
MKPIIVTDVDGILVKWQSGLPYFAQKYNLPIDAILDLIVSDKFKSPSEIFSCDEELANSLMEKYNTSDFIRYLAGYHDAIKYVNMLKDKFDFVAVTALSNNLDARLNRQFNLNALFPGAFKDIFLCSHGESKFNILNQVNNKYGERVVCFIDDMPSHINTSQQISWKSEIKHFWMPRGSHDITPEGNFYEVNTWENIYRALPSAKAINKVEQLGQLPPALEIIKNSTLNVPISVITYVYKDDKFIPVTIESFKYSEFIKAFGIIRSLQEQQKEFREAINNKIIYIIKHPKGFGWVYCSNRKNLEEEYTKRFL